MGEAFHPANDQDPFWVLIVCTGNIPCSRSSS